MRTIYLDMDDVLADFNGKLLKYDIDKSKPYITNDHIMVPLRKEIDTFFINLEPTVGAEYLFDLYNKHALVKILTSTPPNMNDDETWRVTYDQKLAWLKNYIHDFKSNDLTLVKWGEKHRYCKPGDILVDDCLTNIAKWNLASGLGINYIPYVLRIEDRLKLAKNTVQLINNLCR